jgi:hypothetical protein
MVDSPDDGEDAKRRKAAKHISGWLTLQILGILLRHYLPMLWNGNGPTW